MIPFLLAMIWAQTADELVNRLEARSAAARGIVVRTHAAADSIAGDERYERACAVGRSEVSKAGTLWNEAWTIWIGPLRKSVTTSSIRSLTTRDDFLQLIHELGGFEPKVDDKRLEVLPAGGTWNAHPGLDPWLSRGHGAVGDGIEPLLLYALLPELLRAETDLKIAKSDDLVWILEGRRGAEPAPVTKRFTIGKADLAFQRVEIERAWRTYSDRFEFESTGARSIRGLSVPLEVRARFHGSSTVVRWDHQVDEKAPEPPARAQDDFPEKVFPTPGVLDRKAVELRRLIRPEDPQPLADLAWGQFPWKRWWSYRYFEERENNRWMLKALREVSPRCSSAREEWLHRTRKSGDPGEAFMVEGAPVPLYNHAGFLFSAGKLGEAEAIARKGFAAADGGPDRLNWGCLLSAVLAREEKRAESTTLWLDLAAELDDPLSWAQVFLAEVALGQGLVAGFDPEILAKREGLAAALPLVLRGEGDAFSRAVRLTASRAGVRPLMSELVFQRKIRDVDLSKDLGAIEDVDTLLAAAALRSAEGDRVDDLCARAVALWEKEATCRPWTWELWGRTTLRMLKELRALGQDSLGLRVASRFIEKCAEGKVSLWLGMYRWGDLVGDCLLPLRTQGSQDRWVELLALSPELASRIAFGKQKGFVFPMEAILEHLGKTRKRDEAVGWVRMAAHSHLKGDALRPLAALAREIAPDSLDVENAWLEAAGAELPLEKKVDLLRRTITAIKAGTYRDWTGGNYGMWYERLAELQTKAGTLDDAAATTRDMVREFPDMDSMSVINLGTKLGVLGRKDLAKELYLVAARHNAHLRPSSAQSVIERLEPLGEDRDIYALCIRTRETWRGGGGQDEFVRSSLEAIRKAEDRAAKNVRWDEVFKPYLEGPHPPLSKEHAVIAERALEDLRADPPEQRDRAERILSLLGDAVIPYLKKAALDGETDLRGHSRAIVERIYVDEWK